MKNFKITCNACIIIACITICQIPVSAMKMPVQGYASIPLEQEDGKTVIPINTSFPIKGDHAVIGKKMLAGVKNYLKGFKHLLKGVNGKELSFIIKHRGNNDSSQEGLHKAQELQKKSPIFIGLLGTELLLSLVSAIQKKEMLMLFPSDELTTLREAAYPNIIYFGPSHEQELQALVYYTIKKAYKKKIAIFYEASLWGEDALKALQKILRIYKVKPIAVASYSQGTVEVANALAQISKQSPNAVFCLSHPRATYSFIRNALNVGLHKCMFLGHCQLNVIQKLLKTSRGLDVVTTSVVPDPATSDIPLAKEYKTVMKSFLSFNEDSPFYFEAYIHLALLVECLKRIQGTITIEKIIETFASFKHMDFKGLPIHFDEKNRSLSNSVWINPGIGKKWILFNHNEDTSQKLQQWQHQKKG